MRLGNTIYGPEALERNIGQVSFGRYLTLIFVGRGVVQSLLGGCGRELRSKGVCWLSYFTV